MYHTKTRPHPRAGDAIAFAILALWLLAVVLTFATDDSADTRGPDSNAETIEDLKQPATPSGDAYGAVR